MWILSRRLALSALLLPLACQVPDPSPPSTSDSAKIDLSGLRPFWRIADQLLQDQDPPQSDWEDLFATPGYALMAKHEGSDRNLRKMLPLALKPSLAHERGGLSTGFSAILVEHLRAAVERRVEIEAFAEELAARDLTSEAMRLVSAWLPEGAIQASEPPLISFIILEPDARGYEHIVIDIAFAEALQEGLTPIIAHETHHVLRNAVEVVDKPVGDFAESKLLQWLGNLNAEGIADHIDKQEILVAKDWGDTPTGQIMAMVQGRYIEGYERANATLATVDAQLAAYAEDPGRAKEQGQVLSEVLILGGHPVGFHMAGRILRAFGKERLVKVFADPFAFAVEYSAAAEALAEGDYVLSEEGLIGVERLRAKFSR